jgi:electron transport complex protein RnfG
VRLPETPRLVVTLSFAGLVSGLAIVGAYRLTLPRIQANNAEALQRAVFEVLPGSEKMQPLVWRDGALTVPQTGAAGSATDGAPTIYGGYTAEGGFVGYAIPAAGPGFQDTIRLIYGYRPERKRVVGMAVLESRETPGLGDRIYKDPAFKAEFDDLAVEPRIEVIKGHGEAPNDVDAITGATISSKAVVSILNTSNDEWLDRLPPEAPTFEPSAAPGAETETPKGGPVPGGKN